MRARASLSLEDYKDLHMALIAIGQKLNVWEGSPPNVLMDAIRDAKWALHDAQMFLSENKRLDREDVQP